MSFVATADKEPAADTEFYWQAADNFKHKITLNLRQLVSALGFSSTDTENQWLAALKWMKTSFWQPRKLAPLVTDAPDKTIPPRLLPYLTDNAKNQADSKINQSRYELWIYQQLKRHLTNGSIFLKDSLQYGSLQQELIPVEKMKEQIQKLNLPSLNQPFSIQLKALFAELDRLWSEFNKFWSHIQTFWKY